MNTKQHFAFSFGAVLTLTALGVSAAPNLAQSAVLFSTERVSLSGAGVQANGNSQDTAISADGRFVAFVSAASNLVPGDTNNSDDVFVRDRATGVTSRVSVSSTGSQTTGVIGTEIDISQDGRYVAFISTAAGLVLGDTDAAADTFVHDLSTGVTTLESVTPTGGQTSVTSAWTSISGDGSAVAFHAGGSEFGTTNTLWVRNRVTGTVTAAIRNVNGVVAGGQEPSLNFDGRYLAFSSGEHTLVAQPVTTALTDVYVADLSTGDITLVSQSPLGAAANLGSVDPDIDDAGSTVAFHSAASNLVAGDTNNRADAFVRDLATGSTTRVSLSSSGGQLSAASDNGQQVAITGDGTRVVFAHLSPNVTPAPDNNSSVDIFVRDLVDGTTTAASVSSAGLFGNGFADRPVISADGNHVAFKSSSDALVPGDTNARHDTFVRSQTPTDDSPPLVTFQTTPAAPDGDNGWFRAGVQLHWVITDPDSPVTVSGCQDEFVTTDQPPTDYPCTATSDGGTTGPVTATIARDATPPTIDTTVAPGSPDGAAGWYVSLPTVSATCTDTLSGIADCPAPTVRAEGVADTLPVHARDLAGNTASTTVPPISVDLTNPTLQCESTPDFLLNQDGAVMRASVSDATSGPVSSEVALSVTTAQVGPATAELEGQDRAGRSTTIECGYQVHYWFVGFASPVDTDATNVTRAGATIPVKWRLLDAHGNPVTTLTSVNVTAATQTCDLGQTEDLIEETAAGGAGLQNHGDGYYQFNWQTPKSYAASCKHLTVQLGDGVAHTADFRFTR